MPNDEIEISQDFKKIIEQLALRTMIKALIEVLDARDPGFRGEVADRFDDLIAKLLPEGDAIRVPSLAIMQEVGEDIAGSPNRRDAFGKI